jgi:hypothetical protein
MRNKLKIKRGNVTFGQLVDIYASVEKSANTAYSRGGSNDLWSKLEGAVDRYSNQTGEKFEAVWNRVKKTYSDQTKQGRGSPGKSGMSQRRFED